MCNQVKPSAVKWKLVKKVYSSATKANQEQTSETKYNQVQLSVNCDSSDRNDSSDHNDSRDSSDSRTRL